MFDPSLLQRLAASDQYDMRIQLFEVVQHRGFLFAAKITSRTEDDFQPWEASLHLQSHLLRDSFLGSNKRDFKSAICGLLKEEHPKIVCRYF